MPILQEVITMLCVQHKSFLIQKLYFQPLLRRGHEFAILLFYTPLLYQIPDFYTGYQTFILDTRHYFFPNISYYPEVCRSILGSSLIVCKLQEHISRYMHVSILCSKLSLTNKNCNELQQINLLRYYLYNIDNFAHVCLAGGVQLIVFQQQQKHSLHGSSLSRECLPL